MTLRPRSVLVAAALLAVSLTACDPNRFVSGWVPYWGGSGARSAYGDTETSKLFSEVSPFFYSATGTTTITIERVGTASGLAAAVTAARASGLPVLPSITDGTGKLVMAGVLADPVARGFHVQAIVNLVMAGHDGQGFDGIDLDYEGFAFTDGRASWATTRPNWVAFVNQLGAQLRARGKLLAITIPPEWGTVSLQTGHAQGYWVYAQDEIADAVDRIRLMVYDWSVTNPGPIAPMSWVDDVIKFSTDVAGVPPAKLQLGVPFYGRHWREQANPSQTCPDRAQLGRTSVTTKAAPALLAANNVVATRDASGELKATWVTTVNGPRTTPLPPPVQPPPPTSIDRVAGGAGPTGLQPAKRLTAPNTFVTCQVKHTVYYPDATSVRERAQAAIDANWSGIVVWALGYESADVFAELREIASVRPNGDPTGSLDSHVLTGSSLRLTGWAADPEFDLPVPVRITATGGVATLERTVLARVSRPDVAAALPGIGPFHGFDETIVLPAGTTEVCVTIRGWVGQAATPLTCIPPG